MPATNMTPFAFGENLVRSFMDPSNDPWFVAKDVAQALDYQWSGIRTIQHVPEEWRLVESVSTSFGEKDTWFLSEPGLYFFLGRSDKPKALPFQKWLAGEVLPALRKTGRYFIPAQAEKTLLPQVEASRKLRPQLRERILASALQCARIIGATTQEEIDAIYTRYCEMIAITPDSKANMLPGRNLAREEQVLRIREFMGVMLYPVFMERIHTSELYEVFSTWWKEQTTAEMPSSKLVSAVMEEEYPRMKKGGKWYYSNARIVGG